MRVSRLTEMKLPYCQSCEKWLPGEIVSRIVFPSLAFDLCPHCVRELCEWLEGPSKGAGI